jgi:hypothetical protein
MDWLIYYTITAGQNESEISSTHYAPQKELVSGKCKFPITRQIHTQPYITEL